MTPAEVIILTDFLRECRDQLEALLGALPPYATHGDCACDRCGRARTFDLTQKGAVALLRRLRRFLGESEGGAA